MKKQILTRVIFSLLTVAIISSCKKKSDDPGPQDSITIVSVTPSTGLTDGQSISFDVEVKYTLNTGDTGEIGVGFNSGSDVSSYYMDISSTFAITKGSGTHTFTTTATPKNWGSGKHFQAYVNIVKTPHGSTYSPSAGDTENLSF